MSAADGCRGCPAGSASEDGDVDELTRRGFLSRSALAAAVAVLVAACGDGQIGAASPTSSEEEDDDNGSGSTSGSTSGKLVVTLASYPVLANVGGAARVDGNSRTPVALVRTGATSFVALSMACPHQGTRVSIVSGGFFCPNHGARFTLSGQWNGGQRTSNLRSYANVYDAAAGTVTIG